MAVNVRIGAGIFFHWCRPWLLLLFCLPMLFAGCDDIRRDKKEGSKPADIRDKGLSLWLRRWPHLVASSRLQPPTDKMLIAPEATA